jgi:hypothetical protein
MIPGIREKKRYQTNPGGARTQFMSIENPAPPGNNVPKNILPGNCLLIFASVSL